MTTIPELMPPSPDAFKFSTYGNIPLNGSTGAFNYSLPIFTITNGDLSLPISLDYQTDGLKVDEISSIVGLGWHLNAGGVISRVVRDEPDDEATFRSYKEYVSRNEDYEFIKAAALDDHDTEPDIYSFNVNGIYGKFYFNDAGKPLIDSEENIILNGRTEIIDEKGIKYFFNKTEDNFVSNSCDSHSRTNYSSAWYLTKIISPKGNEIIFKYDTKGMTYTTGVINKIIFDDSRCLSQISYFNSHYSRCEAKNIIGTPILKEIIYNDNKIVFDYLEGRKDMSLGGVALKKIKIYNNKKLIESYELHHQYSVSNPHEDNRYRNKDSFKYRLFLSAVDRWSRSGKKYSYTLDYFSLDNLPPRFSYKQDMYGYYNNSYNDVPFTYPKNKRVYEVVAKSGLTSLIRADKEPNPSYKGLLSKIKYPTGGTTEITYEGNSNMVKQKNLKPKIKSINIQLGCEIDRPSVRSQKFEFISNGSAINFLVGAAADTHACGNEGPDKIHDKFSLFIKNLTTNEIITSIGRQANNYINTEDPKDVAYKIDGTLKGHKYEVQVAVSSRFNRISGGVTLKYNYSQELIDRLKYYGGVRVKQIVDLDEKGKVYNNRKFHYNTLENYLKGSDKTSLQETKHVRDVYDLTYVGGCVGSFQDEVWEIRERERYLFSSGSLRQLYGNQRGAAYYTVITEILTSDAGENGAIEKHFYYEDNPLPNPLFGPEIPNLPNSNYGDVFYGTINLIKNYQFVNNNYRLKSIKDFDYKIIYDEFQRVYAFNKIYDFTLVPVIPINVDNIAITLYHNYIRKKRLKTFTETLYEDNGTLIKKELYKYGVAPYYKLKTKEVTNSDSKNYISNYLYSFDKNLISGLSTSAAHVFDDMVTQNRISTPVQTTTVVKNPLGNQMSSFKKRILYKNTNGVILPDVIEISKGDNTISPRLKYLSYDTFGNPTEIQQENGAIISYFWGYSKQYPIAKIENASYKQIATSLGTTVTNLKKYTEAHLSALNSLRTKMPEGMVSTHTYEPLIGIKTSTDPKGNTITYNYDGFNRLESIKNRDGALLESYEYHYKSTN